MQKLVELKKVVYAELVENEQARRNDTELYPLPPQITAGISRIADRACCKAQERATAGIQRLCESKGIRRLLWATRLSS